MGECLPSWHTMREAFASSRGEVTMAEPASECEQRCTRLEEQLKEVARLLAERCKEVGELKAALSSANTEIEALRRREREREQRDQASRSAASPDTDGASALTSHASTVPPPPPSSSSPSSWYRKTFEAERDASRSEVSKSTRSFTPGDAKLSLRRPIHWRT